MMGLKIFISHAPCDAARCQELKKHLARLRREVGVTCWDRGEIRAGEDSEATVRRELESSDVAVLLISADYIASSACMQEAEIARARSHERKVRVVPVIVSPTDYGGPPFERLQALPRDGRPIAGRHDTDAAWMEVAQELRALVAPRRGEGAADNAAERESLVRTSTVSEERPRRRRTMIAVALGAVLIGVAGLAFAVGIGKSATSEMGAVTELIWAPADCPPNGPGIGYGSCYDIRGLPWLQAQLNHLRAAGARGFIDLPQDPKLDPSSYQGKENWVLYVRGAEERLLIGVGYRRDTRSKDGCLRLYDQRTITQRSATACLDRSGAWWVQDDKGDAFRRIAP